MIDVFLSTLSQMTILFIFILVGFVLQKLKLLPDTAAAVLSKLENYLFVPAVVLSTFISNCTLDKLIDSWQVILYGVGVTAITITVGLILAKIIVKDDFIQKTYAYGLCFANFSFMGIAVVKAMFPDFLTTYLLFTLPAQVMLYGWAVNALLIPKDAKVLTPENPSKAKAIYYKIKPFINPMFIAVILGIIIGVSGLGAILPNFIITPIDNASSCMSPLAMLLTGIVVAKYDLKPVLKMKSLYLVTFLRLIVLPLILCGITYFAFNNVDFNICALAYIAMPLGLNTVVIPTAYGKDTSVAAGMALISHVLSIITIPIMFMLFL